MTAILHSIALALVATAPAAGDGHAVPGLLTPEFTLTIATWITFGLFVFVIARFGWKPITKALDERERMNRQNADRAELARRTAEDLLAQHQERLAGTQAEIDRMIGEGRERGAAIAARIKSEAETASAAITARAREEIEMERRRAIADLRAVAAEAAVRLSERILNEEIDPRRHEKLIEKTLTTLPPH